MCGISGFISPRLPSSDLKYVGSKMNQTLAHRGPDDEGVWCLPEMHMCLAHRRLSILDLSEMGHQPIHSHCGRYVMVYNGEIYNHRSLREKISAHWRGESDSEVLVEAFSLWGVTETLKQLNGMFALALWDREKECLILARDRMGEKPLFFSSTKQDFIFSSELKALHQHPLWVKNINKAILPSYLEKGYIPTPHTIFENTFKLPQGCYLKLNLSNLSSWEVVPFWKLADSVDPSQISSDGSVDTLHKLLKSAVDLRMEADVPLGAFLSGGIDSSLVVALMQTQSSQKIKTFSIGFEEDKFNEAIWAKKVAQHLQTNHTEFMVTAPMALDVIPKLPTMFDEPFGDSSSLPTFLVAQLSKKHVTVCLTGDGGDELFGGYSRYHWAQNIWKRTRHIPQLGRGLLARSLTSLSPKTWDATLGPLLKGYSPGLSSLGDKLHKLAPILQSSSPEAMYDNLFSCWIKPSEVLDLPADLASNHRLPFPPPLSYPIRTQEDLLRYMMYTDSLSYLPDDILVKVDRTSMANSLETRVPLLDHNVVEWVWKNPLSLNSPQKSAKWPLRNILYEYVPKELVDRPKSGFGIPLHEWLRSPLAPWCEDLLSSQNLAKYDFLKPLPIAKKWAEHKSGQRNWGSQLWTLLSMIQWMEQ